MSLKLFQKLSLFLAHKVAAGAKEWSRIAETAAMLGHLLVTLPGRGVAVAAFIYILAYCHWMAKFAVIAYVTFTVLDRNTPHRGGRRWDAFRSSKFFQAMSNYFPVRVVLTHPLPAGENYLLLSHPHAIWFFGFTVAFGADSQRLQARTGLKTFMTTINSNFWLPLAREYLLALGFVTASEESLGHLLTDEKGGNLVCLLPGGSAEAAHSGPDQYRIILNSRRGFCRVALQTGASLVPSISFGEVDCYKICHPPANSWLARWQLWVKDKVGVYPLIFKAPDSCIFWGLPKRQPITIVVGEPIKVKINPKPTREEIAQLHCLYVEKLGQLFEAEKFKYVSNAEHVHLVIE